MNSNDQHLRLIAALIDLRQNARLDDEMPIPPALVEALTRDVSSAGEPDQHARSRIRAWLDGLRGGKTGYVGVTLRAAFAVFSPDDAEVLGMSADDWRTTLGLNLSARRAKLCERLPSTLGTIRYQEAKAISAFVEGIAGSEQPDNSGATFDDGVEDFELLSRDCWYMFRQGRTPSHVIEVVELIAKVTTEAYVIRFAYTGGRQSELNFTHCAGAVIGEQLPGSLLNFRRYPVTFGEILKAGDRRRFAFVMEICGGDEPEPHYVIMPEHPTKHTSLTVQFARDALPVRVNEYAGTSTNFGMMQPQETFVDSSGCAYAEFSNLKMGWTYGLSWAWD